MCRAEEVTLTGACLGMRVAGPLSSRGRPRDHRSVPTIHWWTAGLTDRNRYGAIFDSLGTLCIMYLSLIHKMNISTSPLSLLWVQLQFSKIAFLCVSVLFCVWVAEIMFDGAVTTVVTEQTAASLTAHRLTRISNIGLQMLNVPGLSI